MSGENPQKLRIAMETENKLRLNEAACLYPPKKIQLETEQTKVPLENTKPIPILKINIQGGEKNQCQKLCVSSLGLDRKGTVKRASGSGAGPS